MKVAISLPDSVYQEAEELAHNAKKSRSQLYVEALTEYLLRHSGDKITEAMDRVCEKVGNEHDYFATGASRRTLQRQTW